MARTSRPSPLTAPRRFGGRAAPARLRSGADANGAISAAVERARNSSGSRG